MREYLSDQLHRHGHRVVVSDSTKGLLAAIYDSADGFDVMISDLGLDGHDGFELVQELQTLQPNMRLIFLSGFSGIGIAMMKGASFDARIVTRPFHLRELPERINAILSADIAA